MANPNRPGFKPVRSKYGLTSWDLSFAEPYLVDDALFDETASAICVGSAVAATVTASVATGALGHYRTVVALTDEHVAGAETFSADEAANDIVAGVVVGISRIGDMTGFNQESALGLMFAGPNDLMQSSKYILSAEVEADPDGFLVWVADANEWLFEGQIEAAGSYRKGDGVDVSNVDQATAGIVDVTTGRPLQALDLNTTANAQGFITHTPRYVDNDPEAADARVWFMFNPALTGPHGTTDGVTSPA